MPRHSLHPQILDSVPESHPLYGRDLRTIPDVHLAEGAARAILPAFERLLSRLNGARGSSAVGERLEDVHDLVGSAFRRVGRILVQRMHIQSILPGPGAGVASIEISDEVVDSITLAYVHMAGAFDALAIVNGLLAGLTDYRDMGWQKSGFRSAVRRHAPDAVALMVPEVADGKYLRAVLNFRNTIHKRMPDPANTGRADGDPQLRETRLLLERRSHGDIFEAFQAAGWTDFVGVELVGDYLLLRPKTIMDLMLSNGVRALNQLLDATPVETSSTSPLAVDPDRSLYPTQLRAYAVEYLGLQHLVASNSRPRRERQS